MIEYEFHPLIERIVVQVNAHTLAMGVPHNACLQLRRAVSILAEGKKLLEKARYRAVSCKALLDFVRHSLATFREKFDIGFVIQLRFGSSRLLARARI